MPIPSARPPASRSSWHSHPPRRACAPLYRRHPCRPGRGAEPRLGVGELAPTFSSYGHATACHLSCVAPDCPLPSAGTRPPALRGTGTRLGGPVLFCSSGICFFIASGVVGTNCEQERRIQPIKQHVRIRRELFRPGAEVLIPQVALAPALSLSNGARRRGCPLVGLAGAGGQHRRAVAGAGQQRRGWVGGAWVMLIANPISYLLSKRYLGMSRRILRAALQTRSPQTSTPARSPPPSPPLPLPSPPLASCPVYN